MQAVIVGVGQRGILAVVGVVRVGAASVVVPRGRAGGHVLIHGDDKMQPAQMLVAHAQSAALSQLLFDLKTGLLGVGILHVPVHGGEIDQHAGGTVVRIFGNTGAPVWVG